MTFNKISKIKRHFEFKVNLLRVAFFCYLITFGYFGSVSPSLDNQPFWFVIFLNAYLLAPILIFWYLHDRVGKKYDISIQTNFQQLTTIALISLLTAALIYERLVYSLFGDELAYSGSALGHSIVSTSNFIQWTHLGNMPVKVIVQIVNIFIVTLLLILWKCTGDIRSRKKFFFVLLFYLACRIAFILKGGNGNPHPPMALLPLLISSTIFGVSELALKISYFASYLFYLFFIYITLTKCIANKFLQIGVVLAVATIPLTLDLATIIDHSLFGYIFISALLVYFSTNKNINYPAVFALITIGSFFRLPIILFCAPTLLLFINEHRNSGIKKLIISCIKLIMPCLLFLPIALNSLINGTPATKKMDGVINIQQFIEAILSNFIIEQSIKIFYPHLLILFVFFFIPLAIKDIPKKIIYLFYFLLLLIIYFSISPGLWSYSKYQAEYVAPFIVSSIIVISCMTLNGPLKHIPAFIAFLILTLNLLSFAIPTKFRLEKDHISVNYPYQEAYRKISNLGLNDATYSVGITYGTLTELLNSYTVNSWIIANKKYIYMRNLGLDAHPLEKAQALDKIPNNVALLIQGHIDSEKIIPHLLTLGWKQIDLIQSTSVSPKIYIYVKKSEYDLQNK
jgi:hypothetical protein